ncbi:hypothetical protein HYDPIDRAFT_33698 [Hydnomerulius pinastri MD-312]|uniref:Uncharacterized protein n=1 Tax=Hydnomerulius pinastri MD-312 TaxID=994086 RepID=A0A0C9VZH4_9AGAM|nr:hypothetical protein HYDPIDRAFT_33698 [Hydnomerulius pinastri MD-312]
MFGLAARTCVTFIGRIIGMVIAKSGRGSPFGLAAICFVCFPFSLSARLSWPVPPITNLITGVFVKSALVIGYLHADAHLVGFPGWGIDVAQHELAGMGYFTEHGGVPASLLLTQTRTLIPSSEAKARASTTPHRRVAGSEEAVHISSPPTVAVAERVNTITSPSNAGKSILSTAPAKDLNNDIVDVVLVSAVGSYPGGDGA